MIEQAAPQELSVGPDESAAPDMPMIERAVEDASGEIAPAAGADGTVADDLPAVEEEAGSPAPGEDDS